MGYQSTVQVIRRGGKNRQYYLICPAPLAQALEIEKGGGGGMGGGGQAHADLERTRRAVAERPRSGGGPMPNESPSGQKGCGRDEAGRAHPRSPRPRGGASGPRLKRVNRHQWCCGRWTWSS